MRKTLMAVCVLAAATLSRPAAAQNLLNGSFETGDFTSWTQFGSTTLNGVTCPGVPSSQSGNCAGFFGPVKATGGISQNVTTSIGTSYTFSFWLKSDMQSEPVNEFLAEIGGANAYSTTNINSTTWLQHTATFVATSTSTTVKFTFRDDPGFLYLDNVSLTTTAPEPSTYALLAVGLVGIGVVSRRRRAVEL